MKINKKKIKLLAILVAIIVVVIICIISIFGNDKVVYKKQSAGSKDLTLIGYFERNRLKSYEITYYIQYESEDKAKNAYEMLNDSNMFEGNTTYIEYKLEGQIIKVKTTALIEQMEEKMINEAFGTAKSDIRKKQFKEFAEKNGFVK